MTERSERLRLLLVQLVSAADPAVRLSALAQLRRELDAVETELAADALRGGLSWSQIGEALGISKQAAHRRHSHDVASLDLAAETQHGGRRVIVSSAARRAVRLARREAAAMGSDVAGTEHLLLGLLQCGDSATAEVLDRLGVTLPGARDAIEPTVEMSAGLAAHLRRAGDESMTARPLPSARVSPLARRVLEHALGERTGGPLTALDLLSALLRHDNSGAARTLEHLGIRADLVREEIDRVGAVSGPPPL